MNNAEEIPVHAPNQEEIELAKSIHPEFLPMNHEDVDRCKAEISDKIALTEQATELEVLHYQSTIAQKRFISALEQMPVVDSIHNWLNLLNPGTARNYKYYMGDMVKRNIIPEKDASGNIFTVGHFNHSPHESIVDHIKKVEDWSEGTRQVRAACYISFTAYLERISQGWFRKAMPSKVGGNHTFYQVSEECATEALSLDDWHRFIAALHDINPRDAIIARCMLQGAKRVSEALEVKIADVDFDEKLITFTQKKTGGTIKRISITYPENFMREVSEYIESTMEQRGDSLYLFVTRKGKKLTRSRLSYSFDKAGKKAGVGKVKEKADVGKGKEEVRSVSPHMLRATWVTLAKQQQVEDTEIMKVTGHTSVRMILAYDKTDRKNNYSKKMTLI